MRNLTQIRIFIFTILGIICGFQCYLIISNYTKYPKAVQVYDVPFKTLFDVLPGFTICNNNRVSLKKLLDKFPKLRKLVESKLGTVLSKRHLINTNKELDQFRDKLGVLYAELNVDTQMYLDNATMSELLDISADSVEFIPWIECSPSWLNVTINCNFLSKIESVQDRHCTSLFTFNSLKFDQRYNNAIFNHTSTLNANRSSASRPFELREAVRMLIDFAPSDYGDLKRQIGSRVIFHQNSYVPSQASFDFFVTRGFEYSFNIKRQDTYLTNSDYECINYQEENINQVYDLAQDTPKRLRVVFTKNTCYQNCIASQVAQRMNCWPPFVPYFKNDTFDPNGKLKPCSWFTAFMPTTIFNQIVYASMRRNNISLPKANDTQQLRQDARDAREFKKIKAACNDGCKLSCKITRYKIIVSKTAWPSQIKLDLGDASSNEKLLRHCCALISIKYAHFIYETQEYFFKYNLIDTIGNIGGLLAVWLGLSIVSLVKALERMAEFLVNDRRRRREIGKIWPTNRSSLSSSDRDFLSLNSTANISDASTRTL